MILQTYWTILLIFFTVFLFYYNMTSPLVMGGAKENLMKEPTTTVKKIVAYSLNKQIEREGEEYFCEKKFGNISFANIRYRTGFWNKVENSEFYVASVTVDKRLEPYHYLRIIGVIKGSWKETTIFCQILTNDGNVRIIKSTVTPIWYEKWDMNDNSTYYNPTLLSCRLPILEPNVVLMTVSLSPDPCALPNNFHKILRPASREVNFTLCVKPLNFKKDISLHLVQWIEICKILGAQYLHIFLDSVTKNTRRLLEWYQLRFPDTIYLDDFKPVETTECQNCTANSYFHKTWQRRRYEIVTYNKCFNKNFNSKFIVPLDIDELIVPKTVETWQDLLDKFDNYSSYIVQNVYFFRRHQLRYNKPFFLRENKRIKLPNKKGENGKSFIQTKNSLTVFNHYALHSLLPGVVKDYFLPFRDVQLNHYKESCNNVIFPECNKYLSSPTIMDNVIYKYQNEFNKKYNDILNRLKDDQIKLF